MMGKEKEQACETHMAKSKCQDRNPWKLALSTGVHILWYCIKKKKDRIAVGKSFSTQKRLGEETHGKSKQWLPWFSINSYRTKLARVRQYCIRWSINAGIRKIRDTQPVFQFHVFNESPDSSHSYYGRSFVPFCFLSAYASFLGFVLQLPFFMQQSVLRPLCSQQEVHALKWSCACHQSFSAHHRPRSGLFPDTGWMAGSLSTTTTVTLNIFRPKAQKQYKCSF